MWSRPSRSRTMESWWSFLRHELKTRRDKDCLVPGWLAIDQLFAGKNSGWDVIETIPFGTDCLQVNLLQTKTQDEMCRRLSHLGLFVSKLTFCRKKKKTLRMTSPSRVTLSWLTKFCRKLRMHCNNTVSFENDFLLINFYQLKKATEDATWLKTLQPFQTGFSRLTFTEKRGEENMMESDFFF